MRKLIVLLSIIFAIYPKLFSQESEAEIYLITCNPGLETYSHYGHSALRIVYPEYNRDLVYNWGVFDFSTPNFAWKFAKGRLNYMLAVYPYERFLDDYKMEQRSVFIQKINLDQSEKTKLMALLAENLRPENVKYRYDFFYDDCSTRIRDILEKSLGEKLVYQPEDNTLLPTFRDMVGAYQMDYPWLKLGIDLIMGISADKKASPRDQMFLPFDLQKNLSRAVINRGSKMIPLLQNSKTVIDFDLPQHKTSLLFSPLIVFGILFILMILFTAKYRTIGINRIVDIVLYSFYLILAILMIFFNFFTDHDQMKMNMNIIWLNPFILFCLISIIRNRDTRVWFRLVFFPGLLITAVMFFMPHVFNNALIPLSMILIFRSSVRSGFKWNPFTIEGVETD